MDPNYRLPYSFVLPLLRDWIVGRSNVRNFRDDALLCAQTLGDQLKISGTENIPVRGPYIVTFNHYWRKGFRVWWLVLALASALPVDAHLIMTGELMNWYRPVGGPLSRFMLPRLARVYGFTSMPPMPPRPRDVVARAKAVRQVLGYVETEKHPVLLFAPEGRDNTQDGSLIWPPSGVGRFLLLLAERELTIVPAAGWEAAGALHLRFGAGYQLDVPLDFHNDEKDRAASEAVMCQIAALLPGHLRGEFPERSLSL